MKNTCITLLGLGLFSLASLVSAQEPETAPAPETQATAPVAAPSDAEVKEVISYFLGYQTGAQFASFGEGPVQADDIDREVFYKALVDGLTHNVDEDIQKKDLQASMAAFSVKLQERAKKIGSDNLEKSKAYAAENGKKEGVVTTESGLQYKTLTPAEGRKYDAEKDGTNAQASITYEGRLLDGTVFDKTDDPIDLSIGGVIPGFSEALKLMPIGSEWEIFIPSELGYGEQAPGVLGPNAPLIFKVKLHDIRPLGTPDQPIELTPEMLKQLQEQGLQPM